MKRAKEKDVCTEKKKRNQGQLPGEPAQVNCAA
jgi:hypothetical protein